MRNRLGPAAIVLLALAAIGIVDQIRSGYSTLIIPVVLVAIVFILYKFPPSRFRSSSPASRYRQAAAKSRIRHATRAPDKNKGRRTAPFRVIEGNKKREDEPPTYH